jgi:mRNA deadenylase 3'-5' endonuclease subunit Ccr4
VLRVCSYNLLAQSLLQANANLYASCPADAKHGPSRLHRLGHLLSHLNADVLALQEVEQPTFEWLSAKLGEQGMQGVYKRRTGDQQDGVALFVRATRLHVLATEEVR